MCPALLLLPPRLLPHTEVEVEVVVVAMVAVVVVAMLVVEAVEVVTEETTATSVDPLLEASTSRPWITCGMFNTLPAAAATASSVVAPFTSTTTSLTALVALRI